MVAFLLLILSVYMTITNSIMIAVAVRSSTAGSRRHPASSAQLCERAQAEQVYAASEAQNTVWQGCWIYCCSIVKSSTTHFGASASDYAVEPHILKLTLVVVASHSTLYISTRVASKS